MAYSNRDNQLLKEAVQLTLLKESFHKMTPRQTIANLDLMCESELEYVTTVADRIVEGFFGNIKSGLGNIGKGIAQGAGNAFQGAKQAVGDKVGQAVQGAKQVGSGLAAGAKQIGSNASEMYKTGVADKQSQDAIEKARSATQNLIDLITQAQQSGILGKVNGNISDMTLSEIIDTLSAVKDSTGDFAKAAVNKGFTGGVGQAFRQGFQS